MDGLLGMGTEYEDTWILNKEPPVLKGSPSSVGQVGISCGY